MNNQLTSLRKANLSYVGDARVDCVVTNLRILSPIFFKNGCFENWIR